MRPSYRLRPRQQADPGGRLHAIGGVIVALGLLVMLWGVISFGGATYDEVIKAPPPPTPIPVDAPGLTMLATAGCEVSHGYQVCNNPDGARFLDFFKRAPASTIGRALGNYDPVTRSQTFDFLVVGFDPNEPNPDFRVQPRNLGNDDLAAHGRLPVSNPEWHLAVRDFIADAQRQGGNTILLFGHAISEPVCGPTGCMQWSNRSRFEFLPNAVSGREVRLAPLGRMTKRPDVAPPPQPDQVVKRPLEAYRNLPLLGTIVLTLVLLGLGGFLFVTSQRLEPPQQRRPGRPPTTGPRRLR